MFLDDIQRDTQRAGRYTRNKWSAVNRDPYLTNTTFRKYRHPCPQRHSKPRTPAIERPQAHALDRTATGISASFITVYLFWISCVLRTSLITSYSWNWVINPLNAKLNPVCHPLALLGAHHILHVSRLRVNFNNLSHQEPSIRCRIRNRYNRYNWVGTNWFRNVSNL